MAEDMRSVLATARAGFAAQETEVAAARDRQKLAVVVKRATGTGDIAHTFELGTKQRLVFIRCHFSGSAGTVPLDISLDSGTAAAYDAKLSKISKAGTDEDVNFRIDRTESAEPSPWTFGGDDKIRVDWTNPDPGNITWGIEVGLAVAS